MWVVAVGAAFALAMLNRGKGVERFAEGPIRLSSEPPTNQTRPAFTRAGSAPATPMFRSNPRHSPPRMGGASSHVNWRFFTKAAITGQPVLGLDGTVYIGSHDHFFYAITESGALRFKYDLGDRVFGSALLDSAGNIYVGSDADRFVSLTSNGELRWELHTGADADTNPTLTPDGAILLTSGTDLFKITRDGQVLWRFRARDLLFSSPAVDDDGTIVVGSQDNHLYALTKDGHVLFTFAAKKAFNSSPSVLDDGAIVIGSDDGHVYLIGPGGDLRWESPALGGPIRATLGIGASAIYVPVPGENSRLAALDRATGQPVWQFAVPPGRSTRASMLSAPAVDVNGNVYFGAHDGYLYSLNPDGKLRFAVRTTGPVDSAPTLKANGGLYFGSDDGTLYSLAP